MTNPKKDAKKAAEHSKKAANKATDAAHGIFDKIKEHTPDKKAVDEFQKKWMAMPEKRKKYEHWTDAPQVAAEEVLGMANDIVDFVQGDKTGDSKVFEKAHKSLEDIKKDPHAVIKKKTK